MVANRRRKRSDKPAAKARPLPKEAPDDLDLLAELCATVEHTEMSFASWRQYHDTLDLVVHIFLSPEEAAAGGRKEVKWVRTVTVRSNPPGQTIKEKIIQEIEIPVNVPSGHVLILKGQGDRREDRSGDVKVIITVK